MGININNEIYAAQIRAVYQQTPMVLIVNVVNSALVALILGSYAEHTGWWIFLGLVLTMTGVRAIVWGVYHHHKKPYRPKAIWAQLATLGSGLSGLLWGIGTASLVSDNLVEEMFLAFVIGGMCAGAVFSLSYHLPTFIAYVVPAVLPLSGHFFLDGRLVDSAMGGMLVVFVAAMTFAAYNFSHAFANGARLNVDLTKRTKELVETNAQLAAEMGQEAPPRVIASIDWSRSCLSAIELGFLRGFERRREVPLGRNSTLQLFHGSPRSNMEYIVASTSPESLDEMLGGITATVLAGGHTHFQMVRQHHGDLVINPGSVGMPFKDYVGGSATILSHAEYATIEEVDGTINVSLKRIPLDKDALRQAQRETEHPLGAWLLQQYG